MSAAENIGRVLAQRCLQCGITCMLLEPLNNSDKSEKVGCCPSQCDSLSVYITFRCRSSSDLCECNNIVIESFQGRPHCMLQSHRKFSSMWVVAPGAVVFVRVDPIRFQDVSDSIRKWRADSSYHKPRSLFNKKLQSLRLYN